MLAVLLTAALPIVVTATDNQGSGVDASSLQSRSDSVKDHWDNESDADEDADTGRRLWLILALSVAGVTGMWVALYRRGK